MDRTDEQALARYRYMLQTAPPEDIERAHEEAFARLTPDQRRQALAALAQVVPPSEIRGDDPASLARTATRAEVRQPGTIERAWGSGGAGFGLGSFFFATLAASFIGTAAAQTFFDNDPGASGDTADTGDSGVATEADAGSEFGEGDVASGDIGGDPGDFGGGDFGGGDFGGGDFGGI
jgi:hypothetical protein